MENKLSSLETEKSNERSKRPKPRVLIVDDHTPVRCLIRDLLRSVNYETDEASDGAEAIEKMKEHIFDLIITDLKMQGCDGIDILKAAKDLPYDPKVLLITGYGSIDSAVKAMKLGAFEYIEKPLDLDMLMVIIERALEEKKLRSKVHDSGKKPWDRCFPGKIITKSPRMKKILELIEIISRTKSIVLIEGESGTGKELIARAIHFMGPRRERPFIAVNCGALPEQLLESELFGYVKGAFTGAVNEKKGLFEEANGGTLLFDEIGEMPLPLQVKLLRVLQGGEVRKVGGKAVVRIDTRVIASTNSNLLSLVKEGKFREDLFYRLNVIPVFIPPLRERKEDILPMLDYYVEVFNGKFNKKIRGFSSASLEFLMNYDWPGNCRELEHVVEMIVSLTESTLIEYYELKAYMNLREKPSGKPHSGFQDFTLSAMQDIQEKAHILKVLEKNNWNISRSATALGISRSSLWMKMKKHGIKNPL
ncbi:MAG: sigma-54-dependent transcriptional regulator [bacterium]